MHLNFSLVIDFTEGVSGNQMIDFNFVYNMLFLS